MSTQDKLELEKKTEASTLSKKYIENLLESDGKSKDTKGLSIGSANALSNNSLEDNISRTNVSPQKVSILPPPPLLIRPTPITQSRESALMLNADGKLWNQGDQIA